jgi:ubiquinone/menaquinone biosynthesis C-methylase UbiE
MKLLKKILDSFWSFGELPKYPRIKEKEYKSWNERMFHKYFNERVYQHPNPVIRFIEKKRVDILLQELGQINKSDFVLAAGCGEGYIERRIEQGKLVLIDLSTEAIGRSKTNLGKRENLLLVNGYIEHLPTK